MAASIQADPASLGHPDLRRLLERRVIPVVRAPTYHAARERIELLAAAAFRVIEVTLTIPDGLGLLAALAGDHPSLSFGAGTVLTSAEADAAIRAGAQVIVSPGFSAEVARACRESGSLYIPGVFTPTEVTAAHAAGFNLVKLFPAAQLGPRYLTDLRGPFPHMQFMPTGGIKPADVPSWVAAGAFAAGLGSSLFSNSGRLDLESITAALAGTSWRI
jgi:2-dehydro-3-deoxyphosphogluconate aldolase/(4S)-4-hydroxy-2-oxoglutarate aldolase